MRTQKNLLKNASSDALLTELMRRIPHHQAFCMFIDTRRLGINTAEYALHTGGSNKKVIATTRSLDTDR